MKGLVLNLLQDVVEAEHGADTWDDLLADAGLDGVHTSLGDYPDGHLQALVAAASVRLGLPPDDVIRWFGREALPLLALRHPHFFTPHRRTRDLVLTLNDVIHPEVRKLHPGATPPTFGFEVPGEDRVLITYRSGRRLCALAEGFLEAAAAHFGERATVQQPRCMLRGDDCCVLDCAFEPAR